MLLLTTVITGCIMGYTTSSYAMGAYQLSDGSNVFVYDYGGGFEQYDLGGQAQVQLYPLMDGDGNNVWVTGN